MLELGELYMVFSDWLKNGLACGFVTRIETLGHLRWENEKINRFGYF